MTKSYLTEDTVEQGALGQLRDQLGYATVSRSDIVPAGDAPKFTSYQPVDLEGRLRSALICINLQLPHDANYLFKDVTT